MGGGQIVGGGAYLASCPLALPCLPSPSFRAAMGSSTPVPLTPVPLTHVEAWGLGGGLGGLPCAPALPCTPSSCPHSTVTVLPRAILLGEQCCPWG